MKGARALNKPTKSSKTNCLLELNSYAQTDIETFDKFESSILLIARFFFQANDEPSSKAWKNAFLLAEKYFLPPFGASIAHALSLSTDEICASRIRPFEYYKAHERVKNSLISDEERYFLKTFKFIRERKKSLARANALLVCEGPNVEGFILALQGIVIILGESEADDHL